MLTAPRADVQYLPVHQPGTNKLDITQANVELCLLVTEDVCSLPQAYIICHLRQPRPLDRGL